MSFYFFVSPDVKALLHLFVSPAHNIVLKQIYCKHKLACCPKLRTATFRKRWGLRGYQYSCLVYIGYILIYMVRKELFSLQKQFFHYFNTFKGNLAFLRELLILLALLIYFVLTLWFQKPYYGWCIVFTRFITDSCCNIDIDRVNLIQMAIRKLIGWDLKMGDPGPHNSVDCRELHTCNVFILAICISIPFLNDEMMYWKLVARLYKFFLCVFILIV